MNFDGDLQFVYKDKIKDIYFANINKSKVVLGKELN